MPEREYYSARMRRDLKGEGLNLILLNRLVRVAYKELYGRDYFQQAMGYDCVDAGHISGTMGDDPRGYAALRLQREGLWPPHESQFYTEEELFTVIEFMYDYVSKVTEGYNHTYSNCGMHGTKFDAEAGKAEFRAVMNPLLRDYGDGWILSDQGEVLRRGPEGLAPLLESSVPTIDEKNVGTRVRAAVLKYRRHASSTEDQKDAVKTLADVLEFLREAAESFLTTRDEADLFQLANRFGIRHHRPDQQTDYDPDIWLPWAFYYYLATIHALNAMIARGRSPQV